MEDLPTELIENIVGWVEFPDVCALRLTGRNISLKSSTNATCQRFYSSKRLDITQACLEQLVQFTQTGQIGHWLQRLTLHDCAAREPPPSNAADLLSQALANLCDRPGQLSILLRIDRFEKFEESREIASRLFHLTLSALEKSKLPIMALDIFKEGYMHLHGLHCSLAFSDIGNALTRHDRAALVTSFQSCRKLCLSLGHSTIGFDLDRVVRLRLPLELPMTYDGARHNTQSLCDLLSLCPNLEELQLLWEYEEFDETNASEEELHFFNRVGATCSFASLKRCSLRGIRTKETSIMAFFRRLPQLTELILENISCETGTFDGLLLLVSTTMPELDRLWLRCLHDESGSLEFQDEPAHSVWKGRPGSPQRGIRRSGSDARRLVVPSNRRG
ncbi:uncharacterized protein BO97DRAFT_454430 [Aspergillus homomorphus CBS 101889]|uniref:Uncharacterized protein n=1 Tax=Aspergillus homomorphus (strain CBS 101889) TaxID=1450537 RepID=A0A395HTQ0_ASPHC|nr:hypothetical protein BO97DRAFT_454430 [Aspergillus homomorphus CBS 101889]RAL11187.1 hypothetical protein BO97DRAFT_454430 [Aspergillus homomorphus CBS 101889]